MIGENDQRRCIRPDENMIMFSATTPRTFPSRPLCRFMRGVRVRMDGDAPAHAEMDHERFTSVELSEDIFGASREANHALAAETRRELWRKWRSQVAASGERIDNGASFQYRNESGTNGFDLWKLWHVNETYQNLLPRCARALW